MSDALPELPRAFAVPFERLREWSVRSFFNIDWNWPEEAIQPLATALKRKRVRVDKDKHPFSSLQLITLHFDGTMEPRDTSGKKRFKGRLYFADPGYVVYSKIDVRHGAIGIVPEEMGRVAVSSEYPVYEVRPDMATPRYIKLLFRLPQFRQLVNSMISGASGRKRVKPTQLERIEVPLPPLVVQRAIVDQYQEARAEASSLHKKAKHLESQISKSVLKELSIIQQKNVNTSKFFVLPWSKVKGRLSVKVLGRVAAGVDDFKTGEWQSAPLGSLTNGRSGSTPRKGNREYWGGELPWVSPKDMKTFEINGSEDSISERAIDEGQAPLIPENSILIVVRSGVLQHTVPVSISKVAVSINQDLRAFTVTSDQVLPEFLAVYLRVNQRDLLRLVKSSTTVQSINREWLEEYPIPLPPLEHQRRAVETFNSQRNEVARLRDTAKAKKEQAQKEVEALILGTKTFQGAPVQTKPAM